MNWLRDKKNIALFLLSVAVVFLLVYVLFNNRRGTSEPTATTTASTASTAVDPSGSASTGGTTSDPAASGLPAASDPSTPSATVNSPSGGQAAVNTGTGTIIQINGQGNTVNIDRDGLNAEEEDRLVQLQQAGLISQAELKWWNERQRLMLLAAEALAAAEDAKAAGDLAEYNRLMAEYWKHHDERLIKDFPFVRGITVWALRSSRPSLYNDYGKFEFVCWQKWDPYYRRPMTTDELSRRAAFYTRIEVDHDGDPSTPPQTKVVSWQEYYQLPPANRTGDGNPLTWRAYVKDVLWPEWTAPDYGVLARFAGTGTAPDDFAGVRYFILE